MSSVGMDEATYGHLTYDLTLNFAHTVLRHSPEATFCYVSGAGTGGSQMWAKVKRRTENDLLALGFRAAYMFRPGGLQPVPHQLHVLPLYRWFSWLVPVARQLNYASTLRELGLAMLHVAERGARQGKHPRTGEPIQIAASRVPRFSAGAKLKQAVKG